MIKKIVFAFVLIISMVVMSSAAHVLNAADRDDFDIIYFGSTNCTSCITFENTGILESLEIQGYRVKKYMINIGGRETSQLHRDYLYTYNVPRLGVSKIPIIFVGNTYFSGTTSIQSAYNNGTIQSTADEIPLLDLLDAPNTGVLYNLGFTILLGLVDAFNVCAIAMLLMFISFLSKTKNKEVIGYICFYYITAIFLTYYLIGTVLKRFFDLLEPYHYIFFWIIIVLATILFVLNIYDYIMARREKYEDVKNKLPKGAFKIVRKLMDGFSNRIESGSNSVYIIAFLIGIVVAMIEFPCTGQVYVWWIYELSLDVNLGIMFHVYLILYNLIFVSPLVIISIIAVRSQSIVSVSNFMRERMALIKLINALVFLFVIIYYLWLLLYTSSI